MPLWTPTLYHPGYVAGRYYATGPFRTGASAVTAIDLVYVYPFLLPAPVTIKTIAARVTTAGTASSIKMAIYADHSTLHRPTGAPLIGDNTGQVTTSSAATVEFDNTDVALGPGWYWAASKHTGTLPSMTCIDTALIQVNAFGGTTSNVSPRSVLQIADTYSNNLPTFTGADSWAEPTANAPVIFFSL